MSTPMDTKPEEGLAQQAKDMASSAATATQGVAETAFEQVSQVAAEATTQAKDLVGEAREQLRSQAQEQSRKLAETLRSAAEELRRMASSAEQQSAAQQVVQSIADKGTSFADAIERRGPEGLLGELQDLGRRRPGMFLLSALAAGVAAGRLGRAAMDQPSEPLQGSVGPMARSSQPGTPVADDSAWAPTDEATPMMSGTLSGDTGAMGANETTGFGSTPATDRMASAGGVSELTGTSTEIEGDGSSGMVSGATSSEASSREGTPLPPRAREDAHTDVLPDTGYRTQ